MSVLTEIGRQGLRQAVARLARGAKGVRVGHLAACLGVALALGSCGGGTTQVEPFVPTRLIALGDENSLIVNDGANNGRKFTVNGLDANAARDCLLLPIWLQALTTSYGFVFAECNKDAAAPKAFFRAKIGAKVEGAGSGIAAQVAEQAASGGAITKGDLITVMLGANDLVELADRLQAGTLTAADATLEARRRGAALATQINAILGANSRAIVSTVPDLGLSPYGLALNTASPGAAARLSGLSFEFNAALRTNIDASRFDGRNYGLVLADDLVQSMARNPSSYGLTNTVDAVCIKPLPECTSAAADLVSAAAVAAYLWADDRHLSPAAHGQIGTQALARAKGNPF